MISLDCRFSPLSEIVAEPAVCSFPTGSVLKLCLNKNILLHYMLIRGPTALAKSIDIRSHPEVLGYINNLVFTGEEKTRTLT